MVAKGAHDPFRLALKPLLHAVLLAEGGPETTFDLAVDTFYVGRHKGRLGRAPRVEPNVVEPVRFDDLHNAPPRRHIGSRIARERKDGALEGTPQKRLPAVDHKLRPLGREL